VGETHNHDGRRIQTKDGKHGRSLNNIQFMQKRMPLTTLFFSLALSLGENPFFASSLIKKTYKDHSRGFLFLTAGKARVGVLFSFSSIPIIAAFTTLLHFMPR
jgi:hypothetical protein